MTKEGIAKCIENLIRHKFSIKSHKFSIYTIYIQFQITMGSYLKLLFKRIDKKRDDHNLMINIGGGNYFRRHWRVLDFPTQWYNYKSIIINYKFDLTSNKPFPFSDNSVTFFYLSHTLEHIPQEFCPHILDEIYRCLKPRGAVRITGPDLDLAYEAFGKRNMVFFVKYLGQNIEEKFLCFFASYMMDKVSPKELWKNYELMKKEEFCDFYTQQIPRRYQKQFPGYHINWWNYDKIRRMLIKAGFKNVYRSTEQGSRFSEMRGVGKYCGFDSTHPEISLFVEAVKT